jgi:hypothetical protein
MSVSVLAKEKQKPLLPPYLLTAHTVAVIVDPNAGVSLEDPRANQVAQKDVEVALLNWGRLMPLVTTQGADLIIVVRRSNGRLANETVPDTSQNNRAGVINPIDNGVSIGGQHSSHPSQQPGGTSTPQAEIATPEDSFTVYQGDTLDPLDTTPAWRYIGKNGLQPHSVPAVDAFRKALDEADKAAAAAKHP